MVQLAYKLHCLRMTDMAVGPMGHFLFALSVLRLGTNVCVPDSTGLFSLLI